MTKSQPTLRTARLELVPLGPEHRGLTIQLDTDPDVMKYIAFGKPFTHEQALEVHQWLLESATHVSGLGCWAGFAGGDFVGWWILAPCEDSKARAATVTHRNTGPARLSLASDSYRGSGDKGTRKKAPARCSDMPSRTWA